MVSMENMFEIVDGRQMRDGRRSDLYTISSPMSLRLRWAKNDKLKKESKMRISILISIYTIHFAYLKVYTKFEITGSKRSWDICYKFSLERKKNEQIKGLWSNMWLLFCYTIQFITIKLCTKFQNTKSSSCWEIFDRKKSLKTDRQTDNHIYRKGKNYIPPIYFVPGV